GYHKPTDLALIKIDAAGLKPVKFADAEVAVVGNWVATPGIGLDVAGVGVVSHGVRNLTGTEATDMNNANRGFLGVTLVTTDTGDGALIRSVEATAARAGLKMNDLICEVAGKTVKDSPSLMELMEAYKPGDTVTIRVKRGDEELSLKIKLSSKA